VTTVVSNMIADTDKQMIIKFLDRNYPVSRVKINKRFKRAIILDTGVFVLGGDNIQKTKQSLIKILSDVFYIDEKYLTPIVNSFMSSR
jgi:hypothetical protein